MFINNKDLEDAGVKCNGLAAKIIAYSTAGAIIFGVIYVLVVLIVLGGVR